jgi:hypothetical protein
MQRLHLGAGFLPPHKVGIIHIQRPGVSSMAHAAAGFTGAHLDKIMTMSADSQSARIKFELHDESMK